MSEQTMRVRVEELDWATVFPFLRLFGAFRIAIHPYHLGLALLMVVLMWVGGHILSWGSCVYPDEFARYCQSSSPEMFDQWLERQQKAGWEDVSELNGVFQATWRIKMGAFHRLVTGATHLNFGVAGLLSPNGPQRDTVAGALYEMTVSLPCWLWRAHRGFFVLYGVLGMGIWSFFGGAIARMTALSATGRGSGSLGEALRFVCLRWPWFVLAPLLPVVLAGLLGAVLWVGGLVFFNGPIVDTLGAVLFFIALACGGGIAFLLLLEAAGVHLFYPAIAVEGTDGFDAISRSFAGVLERPWKWLFYTATALVYGAIAYLLVGVVVFLTLWATQRGVGLGVFREVTTGVELTGVQGVNRFDAIMPPPAIGQLVDYEDRSDLLPFWSRGTAGIIRFWVCLVAGLMPAFAISFYFSANTWIYLLLRKSADGIDYDEIFVDPSSDDAALKMEPPQAASTQDGPSPPPAASSGPQAAAAAPMMPTVTIEQALPPEEVEEDTPGDDDADHVAASSEQTPQGQDPIDDERDDDEDDHSADDENPKPPPST